MCSAERGISLVSRGAPAVRRGGPWTLRRLARDDPMPTRRATTPPTGGVVSPQTCCAAFNRPQRQARTPATGGTAATAAAPHGRAHHRPRHRTTHRQHRGRARRHASCTRSEVEPLRRHVGACLQGRPPKSCGKTSLGIKRRKSFSLFQLLSATQRLFGQSSRSVLRASRAVSGAGYTEAACFSPPPSGAAQLARPGLRQQHE